MRNTWQSWLLGIMGAILTSAIVAGGVEFYRNNNSLRDTLTDLKVAISSNTAVLDTLNFRLQEIDLRNARDIDVLRGRVQSLEENARENP